MNTKNSSIHLLSTAELTALLQVLRQRFVQNPQRHPGLDWSAIQARLEADPGKAWSLSEMERTGGEPDAIMFNPTTGEYTFCDCCAESPAGRRNVCYDQKALEERKEFKPASSALGAAEEMGIDLLTEQEYRQLQELGAFDTKTSSWLRTPPDIRALGGALFGDRRYGHVFVYHNGASSYYGARGFRGLLRI